MNKTFELKLPENSPFQVYRNNGKLYHVNDKNYPYDWNQGIDDLRS